MPDLIAGRVRAVFRNAASSYTVLANIDSIWQAEGFAPGEAAFFGGARVTRWSEYEGSVDWNSRDHANRVVRVYESFLSEFGGEDISNFVRVLSLEGFRVDEHRRISWTSSSTSAPLSGLDQLRDASGILDAFRRIDLLLDSDPAGVVGAVKELIESTAKTVLEHLNEPFASDESFPSLISMAQNKLGLGVASVDSHLDSSDSVKKILGGLKGVAIGISELRNREGSGHGRTRGTNLTTRHARLSLNAGRAWCEIVLDTFGDPGAPWRNRSSTL